MVRIVLTRNPSHRALLFVLALHTHGSHARAAEAETAHVARALGPLFDSMGGDGRNMMPPPPVPPKLTFFLREALCCSGLSPEDGATKTSSAEGGATTNVGECPLLQSRRRVDATDGGERKRSIRWFGNAARRCAEAVAGRDAVLMCAAKVAQVRRMPILFAKWSFFVLCAFTDP